MPVTTAGQLKIRSLSLELEDWNIGIDDPPGGQGLVLQPSTHMAFSHPKNSVSYTALLSQVFLGQDDMHGEYVSHSSHCIAIETGIHTTNF